MAHGGHGGHGHGGHGHGIRGTITEFDCPMLDGSPCRTTSEFGAAAEPGTVVVELRDEFTIGPILIRMVK